jgi:hypothetical protein
VLKAAEKGRENFTQEKNMHIMYIRREKIIKVAVQPSVHPGAPGLWL